MKTIGSIIALFAVFLAGPASAQVDQTSACVPYTVPIESTVTACGNGMLGSKYKTATKACPSGEVTHSVDYVTSGCYYPTVGSGHVNTVNPCVVTPDACAPQPLAKACPTGKKWSLAGSGIAHCVLNDPVCGFGESLTHDYYGNPSCVANTCPSNQVLQGDGISCACPVNTTWNGSSCVDSTPTCVAGNQYISTFACPSGFTGTRDQYQQITCPSGPYGAPVPGAYWNDESRCVSAAVTCSPSTVTEWANCSTGTGQQSRVITTSCPSGAYGSPSVSTGSWDQSACVAACTETYSTVTTACGTGFTGNKYVTTTNLCPSGTSTSTDTSECGCANGGTDYPTCTPPLTCSPSSNTVTSACGTGFTGNKYVTTTTVCPAGTTSTTTDTSSCGCANGGTDYPTCTAPEPTCTPSSSTVTKSCGTGYDGNKYVTTTTVCPSGATSTSTDSSECTPTCTPSSTTVTSACGTGFTGNKYVTTTKVCPGGTTSTSTDTSACGCANGGTNYPTCTPPITCTESETSTPMACGTGYTGTKYKIVANTCPDNVKVTWYNEDSCGCANGGTNYPTCTPPCNEYHTSTPVACGTGYTGTKYRIDYYSCPGLTKSTWYNEDGCGCANGATDYPTCTPPLPPPPPPSPVCMDNEVEDANVCNGIKGSYYYKDIFIKTYEVCYVDGVQVSNTYKFSTLYAQLTCSTEGAVVDKYVY